MAQRCLKLESHGRFPELRVYDSKCPLEMLLLIYDLFLIIHRFSRIHTLLSLLITSIDIKFER